MRPRSWNKIQRSEEGISDVVTATLNSCVARTTNNADFQNTLLRKSDFSVTYFSVTADNPSFKSSEDRRNLSILSTISANVGFLILSDSQQLNIKL